MCLIIATGIVGFFYIISVLTSRTEEGMSFLDTEHQQQLVAWGNIAEILYVAGDKQALDSWLNNLQIQENTWASIATYQIDYVAGNLKQQELYQGFNLGRSIYWKIHLYFEENPVMELPFKEGNISLLIQLPERMRPGSNWQYTHITIQIVLPMILLALLSIFIYRHIMSPLRKLDRATKEFSRGNLEVRVSQLLGNRSDELSELANTFDQMASHIGELILNQRQLISDLSHELRTPLTRLDIALDNFNEQNNVEGIEGDTAKGITSEVKRENLKRINRESRYIRKLVEDTLTLAWLENEQPQLQQESLDLVDLLDILIEDAKFEFPIVQLEAQLPESAVIENSSHRALGQALENIIRNALRYTPEGKKVVVQLSVQGESFCIKISDQGPGVPDEYLSTIFRPFFRLDKSRLADNDSFGLGLALAQRQLQAVKASVLAENIPNSGLCIIVLIPKC
ncbi:histidine kinase sensor domain-containing protein [Colwellia sp. UCD-KL20]|uniref:histidine kinase sensor domain-containing protein n=1 Tax=Colwellia sp. UCD-KL20 TaxID=1917165 RepID=UPI00336C133E